MFADTGSYEWDYFAFESSLATGSDKIVTLPTEVRTLPIGLRISLTSTATPGNRFVTVDYRDPLSSVMCRIVAGKEQSTSVTRNYELFPSAPLMTDFYATDELLVPLPQVVVPAGGSIRVWDSQAVDSANDTITFTLTAYQRRA